MEFVWGLKKLANLPIIVEAHQTTLMHQNALHCADLKKQILYRTVMT